MTLDRITTLFTLLLCTLITAGCKPATSHRTAPMSQSQTTINHSAVLPKPALILSVSPRGALPSLDAARDHIRAIKKSRGLPAGGILVTLEPGDYPRTDSFTLTEEDSGTAEAPIVYSTASPSRGSARILGGHPLRNWRPVRDPAILERLIPAARGRVFVADLRANGVTDFGHITHRGHGPRDDARLPLELFHLDQPLQVARWPNLTPWPNDAFAVNNAPQRAAAITCENAPFSRWKGENPDAFIFAYTGSEWSYHLLPVTHIDTEKNQLTINGASGNGDRFFVANILEELDRPGEYLLDRAHGLIYFIPPATLRDNDAAVSIVSAPLVHFSNASHITLERLGVELTRGQGVRIDGGHHITLAGCVVRNVGTEGVYLNQPTHIAILSCDIFDTGDTGVYCNVGDRLNLVPGNVLIRNNHFNRNARIAQVYCGAVGGSYGGYIGVEIANNLIHDMNHTAIFFWGNEIRMERNEIYNVVLQSDDAGAIYTGRDMTFQGNTYVNNYMHHTGSSGRHDVYGTMGLYHDDGAGGTHIEGNIFEHVSKPVFAGGGLDTQAINNIFVDCHPTFWIDERLLSGNDLGPSTMVGGFMLERYNMVKADSDIWTKKYPLMAVVARHYREGKGIPPYSNAFRRNIVWRAPQKWMVSPWVAMPDKSILDLGDNLIATDPRFVDASWSDFALRPDSPALAMGFTPIDMKSIGLQHDAYRTTIDRVESHLELVRPFVVTGRGAVGRVKLSLRNTGDSPIDAEEFIHARGVVRVEAAGYMDGKPGGNVQAVGGLAIGEGRKTLGGAPPKIATIADEGRWAFSVKPGQTVEREFDITLAPGSTRDYDELQIDTRGRIARPARLRVPFEYPLVTKLELTQPLSGDAGAADGAVRLTVNNTGTATAEDTLQLRVTPAVWAALSGAKTGAETTVLARAAAKGTMTADYQLILAPDVPMGAPLVQVAAEGVATAKAALRVPIARSIPSLPPATAPEGVAALFGDERAYQVFPDWSRQAEPGQSPFGQIRFAIVGDSLAVFADVRDPKVDTTDMLWTGSCIEVFGAAAHGRAIGQVFLLPACDGKAASGFFQDGPEARPAPEIRVVSKATDGGYQLTALIPLRLLSITDANRFIVEAAITTSDGNGTSGARRGVVFGSQKAYADNNQYGTVTKR